jgi:Tol biopolymer transport system component/predicted Ser/Thr protein kinase
VTGPPAGDRDADVERICQAALDRPREARAALLDVECRGDDALRHEVERLLAFEAAADRFLERETLPIPSRLGPFEITSVLGIGGMGEVYGGRDTVLARDVAVKVLPRSFARDPERVARLLREARALASLNHPNIAQIYGVEQGALVMERVRGRTLVAPLPVAAALECASQIAAALEAAHEKGVVHRDLKPANVMAAADGTVKVLDFGLAAIDDDPATSPPAAADAAAVAATVSRAGAVMGTPAYMSPEQAAGTPVDKRTDIWSFGVLVYELLTGRRLFEGESTDETLVKVRTAAIDLDPLPRETPPGVRDLLARCLDRNPRTRLRDIGEARIHLQRARETPLPAAAAIWRQRLARAWPWAALAVAAAAILLLAAERRDGREPAAPAPVTFHVEAPPQVTVVGGPALSPDGRHVAFTAKARDGRTGIWVHALQSGEARLLAGTEDAFDPLFWSPDGRFVGFATGLQIRKVAIAGGPPVALCDRCGPTSIGSRVFRGGAWNVAGEIVFAMSSHGLWRVPAAGGTPRRVTPAGDYGYPTFLPDGAHVLYTWFGRDPQPGIYVADIRQDEPRPARRLVDGAFAVGGYAPRPGRTDGYLLALREGVLTARAFDPITATASGEPLLIAEGVPVVTPPAAFSASRTGAVAFTTSTSADSSQLLWFDRTGAKLGALGPRTYGANVSISPDGRQIAFDSIDADRRTRHAWTADAGRGVATMVSAPARVWAPIPGVGGVLAFAAPPDLYLTRLSAGGPPDLLYASANGKVPNDWSRDGRFLTFNELHPTRRSDLYVLRADRREAIPLVVTDADELPAVFSPDGRWVAYSSDETGVREVYVRDFAPDRSPAVGAVKERVSTDGGDKPRWRRDGTELYYLASDGGLMAVPVRQGPAFNAGTPVRLFDVQARRGSFFPYDVAADGRFLVDAFQRPDAQRPDRMTVALNWMSRVAAAP